MAASTSKMNGTTPKLLGRTVVLLLIHAALHPAYTREPEAAPPLFEVAAWVDHFDFAGVRRNGTYGFDSETLQGCTAILNHVQETGATTIWWRNCGGATMRYGSTVDTHHHAETIDKRRLPDNRTIHGWVRYGNAKPDIIAAIMALCQERKLDPGVHWPFEENHWSSWTLGGWNLDHPQYWCRDPNGIPWAGRASAAYPDVVEHKLALLRELIDRGMKTLFIDTWRSGAWSPAMEYVPPVIDSWKAAHQEPPPSDPRDPEWCAHVATYVTSFMKRIRKTLDESGRDIRFIIGVFAPAPDAKAPIIERGVDWIELVEQGVVDGIVINAVRWSKDAPLKSTAERYEQVIRTVDDRCLVFCPVRAYDYAGFGMPSYCRETGLSQPQVAEKLVRIAWECGADGISLECVDYNNYTPETRKVLRTLMGGDCKHKRQAGKKTETPIR